MATVTARLYFFWVGLHRSSSLPRTPEQQRIQGVSHEYIDGMCANTQLSGVRTRRVYAWRCDRESGT